MTFHPVSVSYIQLTGKYYFSQLLQNKGYYFIKNLKRKRNVNKNARQLVTIATEKGYTYEGISDICDVSIGTVKRWLATGRADANKINSLETEIGLIYLQPESVGDILIEIYKNRKKRFRLKRFQLKRIAGRAALRNAFVDKLTQYLLHRGFFMLECVDGDNDIFIIIRVSHTLNHVKDYLRPSDINKYFKDLANEIDQDCDDE